MAHRPFPAEKPTLSPNKTSQTPNKTSQNPTRAFYFWSLKSSSAQWGDGLQGNPRGLLDWGSAGGRPRVQILRRLAVGLPGACVVLDSWCLLKLQGKKGEKPSHEAHPCWSIWGSKMWNICILRYLWRLFSFLHSNSFFERLSQACAIHG